jgi:hypothetical protein
MSLTKFSHLGVLTRGIYVAVVYTRIILDINICKQVYVIGAGLEYSAGKTVYGMEIRGSFTVKKKYLGLSLIQSIQTDPEAHAAF